MTTVCSPTQDIPLPIEWLCTLQESVSLSGGLSNLAGVFCITSCLALKYDCAVGASGIIWSVHLLNGFSDD